MKKTTKAWDTHERIRGRKSGKQEKYIATSPRVEVDNCTHTQFLDTDITISRGTCLDCGCQFVYRNWKVDKDIRVLNDNELQERRDYFNQVWFGPDPEMEARSSLPSIEQLTAEVARLSAIMDTMKKER